MWEAFETEFTGTKDERLLAGGVKAGLPVGSQ